MVEFPTMTDLPRTRPTSRKKNTPWHNADIVAAVKKAGSNLRQLSLRHGFAASTFRAALHRPHPRANRLIAEFIGVAVHEIWPHWFTTNGVRKPGIPMKASRLHPAPSQEADQSREAA